MKPGDVVAIVWPATDYDVTLAGTEQIVQVGNILGGKKKGTTAHTALVTLYDRDTLQPVKFSWRAISPDVDVIEMVERSRWGHDDGDGGHTGEDFSDPLQGRRR